MPHGCPEPSIEIEVTYSWGSRSETWISAPLSCPRCGSESVWVEAGGGDYYEGPQHLCTTCKATFSLPRLHDALPDPQNQERLDVLSRQPPRAATSGERGNT